MAAMLICPFRVATSGRGVRRAGGPIVVPWRGSHDALAVQGHVESKQDRVIQQGARARKEDARTHAGGFIWAVI